MNRSVIDLSAVSTWDSFHDLFVSEYGFPEYYGRNMDAWIDCMEEFAIKDSPLVLCITGIEEFKKSCPEIYDTFIESASYINFRAVEAGEESCLALSYS